MVFGIGIERIRVFNGVDELAWINEEATDEDLITLGLKGSRFIVLRPMEFQASYLAGYAPKDDISLKIINEVLNLIEDVKIVYFPRYEEQRGITKIVKSKRLIIPKKPVNTLSLYKRADLVITGGGTMGREAALLGIPAISYFQGEKLDVNTFLKRLGFPIWELKDVDEVLHMVKKILTSPDEFKLDTRKMIAQLENPLDVIQQEVEALLRG